MRPYFDLNDENMRADLGATEKIAPQALHQAHASVKNLHDIKKQGWLAILDDKDHLNAVGHATSKYSKIENCLLLGIGGSDLGARMMVEALGQKLKNTRLWFAGDTTDPEEISRILDAVPWGKTCINVISKSGGTLETMATFFEAKRRLEAKVGVKKAAERIICTTDPEQGALHDLAIKEGFAILPIPQNIGGRYSVLTAVGLFPLALAGIDVKALLRGAKALRDEWWGKNGTHPADRFAAWQVAHDRAKGRNMHIMFSYAAKLDGLSHWWRQLWAESLGKAQKRDGHANRLGPTPITALGPKDQHSQLQLYQDGPDDKIYTFLVCDSKAVPLRVPASVKRFGPIAHAAGLPFSRLLKAEAQGTIEALLNAKRPVGVIGLPKIDEATLGALIVFFELATAMAGELYDVNAFDQPGVEASKHRAREFLTR